MCEFQCKWVKKIKKIKKNMIYIYFSFDYNAYQTTPTTKICKGRGNWMGNGRHSLVPFSFPFSSFVG
jgi:hypothetical protein